MPFLLSFVQAAPGCQAQPEEDAPPPAVLSQIHPAIELDEPVADSDIKLSVEENEPEESEFLISSSDLPDLAPISIAQSSPTDTLGDTQPIDLTPVSLPRRAPNFNRFDQFKGDLLYRLPGKMFFSCVAENSLRLETNVFQTRRDYSSDMVYRILPNINLGYALNKKTRISCNYFYLRDQYTKFNNPLSRDFHSIGYQIQRDVSLPRNINMTVGFFGRALFTNLDYFDDFFFNDLIPSVTLQKRVGMRSIVYASCLGQVRFRSMLSRYQEFDQFYSGGIVHRRGAWSFLADSTLASNFGRPILRGGGNNQVIILTQEAARQIHHRIPFQVFARGEEIFNVGAINSPGFAGFNYRIFGGIRLTIAKPAIFPIKLKGS